MAEEIELTTELDAVNSILASVGEAPVVSLDGLFVDAELALKLLRQTSRRIQSQGWDFNTDLTPTLGRDINGYIIVPSNALRVVLTDKNLVTRSGKLYDRSTQSDVFTENKVTEKIVYLLPWEDLPEPARAFIAISAARRFQDRYGGDAVVHRFHERDELSAWANLQNYKAEVEGLNALSSSTLVQRLKQYR